jgi:hypothetical protein
VLRGRPWALAPAQVITRKAHPTRIYNIITMAFTIIVADNYNIDGKIHLKNIHHVLMATSDIIF